MKTFLLIFIFALSLKADGYYMGKCVHSIESFDSTNMFTINFSGNWTPMETSNTTVFKDILPTLGLFEYDPLYAICKTKTTTTNNTQVLISSLTGILIGFVILFFSIFLTLKVGSRND